MYIEHYSLSSIGTRWHNAKRICADGSPLADDVTRRRFLRGIGGNAFRLVLKLPLFRTLPTRCYAPAVYWEGIPLFGGSFNTRQSHPRGSPEKIGSRTPALSRRSHVAERLCLLHKSSRMNCYPSMLFLLSVRNRKLQNNVEIILMD